jgi:hypothetical protein
MSQPSGSQQPDGQQPGSQQSFNQQPQITPEEQVIEIEANRLITQQQVTEGSMPPLPFTEMTPPDATSVGGKPLLNNGEISGDGDTSGNGDTPPQ